MAMNNTQVNLNQGCFRLDFQDSTARQIFAPRQLLLHCSTTRHPWRYTKSTFPPSLAVRCRQGYKKVSDAGP